MIQQHYTSINYINEVNQYTDEIYFKLAWTTETKYYRVTDPKNRDMSDFELTRCSVRPYGKWYEKVTGKPHKNKFCNYAGIFSLSKETIRKYPITFYQNLISYL